MGTCLICGKKVELCGMCRAGERHQQCVDDDLCHECFVEQKGNGNLVAEAPRPSNPPGSDEMLGSVVDSAKISELGQAFAQFELIRTMATKAQARYGKHLELCDVERMGDIAKDANEIMGKLMAALDRAK
jgi:hypothetical protein